MTRKGCNDRRRSLWGYLPVMTTLAAMHATASDGAAAPRPAPAAAHRPLTVAAMAPHLKAAPSLAPALKISPAQDFGFLRPMPSMQPAPAAIPATPATAKNSLTAAVARATPAVSSASDITLDSTLVTAHPVPFSNGTYTIAPSLGKQVGANLFYSFNTFSIGTGDTASFGGTPAMPVQNVLARVTGAAPSNIDGTLQCTIQNADFYLINPNGIVFGANSKLDLQGAFAVTTADYLRLGAGSTGTFAASNPSSSVLTAGSPAAFGFLATHAPAAITVNGQAVIGTDSFGNSNLTLAPILSPPAGKALLVVGGDISVTSGMLAAAGGAANFVSVASAGEATLPPQGLAGPPDVRSFTRLGTVKVAGLGFLGQAAPSGLDGAPVNLFANTLNIDGSDPSGPFTSFVGSTAFTGKSADVNLSVAGNITLSNGGMIGVNSLNGGAALTVTANSITIMSGTIMTYAPLSGDTIQVAVNGPLVMNNASIFSESFFSTDPSGNIPTSLTVHVTAASISMANSFIDSDCNKGASGNVLVSTTGALSMMDSSITSAASRGPGSGTVTVTAGDITMAAGTVSFIGTSSDTTLVGGAVSVTATGAINMVDGRIFADGVIHGGAVSVTAASLSLGGSDAGDHGEIGNSTVAIAGSTVGGVALDGVTVRTSGALQIFGDSFIRSTQNDSARFAGTVSVSAGAITIDAMNAVSPGGVFVSGPLAPSATVPDIQITAGSLTVTNGAQIAADSFSATRSGNIQVDIAGAASITGGAGIFARSFQSGAGGVVSVNADSLNLDNGFISASNFRGAQSPGQVNVHAGTITLDHGASISATTGGGLADDLSVIVNFGPNPVQQPALVLISPTGTSVPIAIVTGGTLDSPVVYGDGEGQIAPIGFLSHFIARDLVGVWTLKGGSFDPLISWSLALGGKPIGASAVGPFGLDFNVPLTVSGADPGLTGGHGGTVSVVATNLNVLGGSTISAGTLGTSPGGGVNVNASAVLITGVGSRIDSQTAAPANGQLTTQTGSAGNVTLVATQSLALTLGGAISSTAQTSAGGDITVQSPSVSLSGGSTISASALQAGRISIDAGAGTVSVTGGSSISTDTSFSSPTGSDVKITAAAIAFNDSALTATTTGTGVGGNISLAGNSISLSNSTLAASSTLNATGAAGSVSVDSTGLLSISGTSVSATSALTDGGAVHLSGASGLTLTNMSLISAQAADNAGGITLDSPASISLLDSQVQAQTQGLHAGVKGGDIAVTGGAIHLGNSSISASATGEGSGGNIAMSGSSLQLSHASKVTASTSGMGTAGSVIVMMKDGISMSDASSISADTTAAGSGGNLQISGSALNLMGGSSITSSSTGSGTAGSIVITAKRAVTLDAESSIAATSAQSAAGDISVSADKILLIGAAMSTATPDAGGSLILKARDIGLFSQSTLSAIAGQNGNISLLAPGGTIHIRDSKVTAQASGAGGGKIFIDPTFVILENSTLNGLSANQPVQVVFDPSVALLSSQSQILTSALILPPPTDVAAALIALPSALPQMNLGLAPICAPRLEADFSSFIITGQGGRPPQPGGWMPDLPLLGVQSPAP